MLKKKYSSLTAKRQPHPDAKDIDKVMQFECRVFKTLEHGAITHFSSPESSPDKASYGKSSIASSTQVITDIAESQVLSHHHHSKLRAGLESGYLGDSRDVNTNVNLQGYENDVTRRSRQQCLRKTPTLKRANSFSNLSPVTEEDLESRNSPFIQPYYITEQNEVLRTNTCENVSESSNKSKKSGPARKLKFFDVRNLRLSFRRKNNGGSKQGGHSDRQTHKTETKNDTNSSVKIFQNGMYFEKPVADCIHCMRLLKDPQYCECPRNRSDLSDRTKSIIREKSVNYLASARIVNYDNVSVTESEQKLSISGNRNSYSDVQLRKTPKVISNTAESVSDMIKSLNRFSVSSDFVDNYDKHLKSSTVEPPKESEIYLVRNLYLPFLHNKFICDMVTTKHGDIAIVDSKYAYMIDIEGKLKRMISSKGNKRLQAPVSISRDKNSGNLVIVDHSTQNLQIFAPKGQHLIGTIEDNKTLSNISMVSCNGKGQVLVTSTDKKLITVHSQDNLYIDSVPPEICDYSYIGNNSGEVSLSQNQNFLRYQPYSITVNYLTADIIIGDNTKQIVVAISPNGVERWCFVPPPEFRNSDVVNRPFFPNSLCADHNGYIFVADINNENVYMLDSGGKCLKTLLSRDNGLKGGPLAITTDMKGHLFVTDEEKTVKMFKYGDGDFTLYRRFSLCHKNPR